MRKITLLLSALATILFSSTALFAGFDPVNFNIYNPPFADTHPIKGITFKNLNDILSVQPQAITPKEFYNVFEIKNDNLFPRGDGESIAVIETTSAYNPEGLKEFDDTFNLANPDIKIIKAGSPVEIFGPEETMLDVELVHMVAPKAKIYLIQWDGTSGVITKILNEVNPDAISVSMGYPSNISAMLMRLPCYSSKWYFLESYNSFVASGDNGTETSFPSCLNNIVSVGGFSFQPNEPFDKDHYYGWANSGGGYDFLSRFRSTWQVGNKSIWRGIPDISFLAGWPRYTICVRKNNWMVIGGTSTAAPVIAASWILGDELHYKKYGNHLPPYAPQIIYDLFKNHKKTFIKPKSMDNGTPLGPNEWNTTTGIGIPDLPVFIKNLGDYEKTTFKPINKFYSYFWWAALIAAFILFLLIFSLAIDNILTYLKLSPNSTFIAKLLSVFLVIIISAISIIFGFIFTLIPPLQAVYAAFVLGYISIITITILCLRMIMRKYISNQ